tara:strand:+ start:6528 stop:7127 length:600 start_codon:yes stop_codon:yes gene_type:complete
MKKFITGLALIIMIGLTNIGYAQTIYKIGNSKNNSVEISGTSTLKDWEMSTESFNGNAQFSFKPGNDNDLTAVTSLNFSVLVKDLKSGTKGLDKHAYEALKAGAYKNILFILKSADVVPLKDNKYKLTINGTHNIAGVEKDMVMEVYATVNTDGSITFRGSDELKMTDYKVEPPTFLFGAMKSGDKITLDFTLVYEKAN